MGDRTAFFYGTLMAEEILYRVIYGTHNIQNDPVKSLLASKLKIQPAILHGFCRHQVKCADYPGVIPETGQTVRGTYVSGLTDGDIHRLDQFEGTQYTRKKVFVELLAEEGNTAAKDVEAETYEFTYGELEKQEWDYEHFRQAKMGNWIGSRTEYVDVEYPDDDVPEGHDPTGGRAFPKEPESLEDGSREKAKEDEMLKAAV